MGIRKAPSLLPIFRSEQQLRLLGHLFVRAGSFFSLAEIARATGIPQQTLSREVARLERAGLIAAEHRGRLKLVRADERSPYFPELHGLLMKVFGPAVLLAEGLREIRGVMAAFIFGSWARRYQGEPGPPPRDIDLLVVGEPDTDEVREACRRAEAALGMEVNAVVLTTREWSEGSTGFLREIRRSPRVPVLGEAA